MKPRTQLEKEVVELAKELPALTEKQLSWGYDHCLDKKGVITKDKAYCLECGKDWIRSKSYAKPKLIICPCCGAKQKVLESKKRTYKDGSYYGVMTTFKGYQVFRIIILNKFGKAGRSVQKITTEVMQHWIHPSGKMFLFALQQCIFSYVMDNWISGSELELRTSESWASKEKLSVTPYKIYPGRTFIPELKRNGLKKSFYNSSPTRLMHRLLIDREAETLLKAGQHSLLTYVLKNNGWRKETLQERGIWNSVKICIRNNYIVQDAVLWVDYLQLLTEFNKDLLNSHYVCPVDLKASHDSLMVKKRKKDRQKRLEDQKREAIQNQISYAQEKGKFFGLAFTQGDLTIKVLESVEEFMQEGDLLHHCVFVNGYYKKASSLVLSARIDDQPVETVEISLDSLEIIQSRGRFNQPSEHHDQVISLVSQNLPAIGRLLNQ